MEIERKWMVTDWPRGLRPVRTHIMDQGYLCVRPTVRIRREALEGGPTALVLCFKGAPDPTGLSRPEVETEISPELFAQLEELIGKPLIRKERRSYLLPEGLVLEVNEVDPGQPGGFFYAEVEFPTEQAARAWGPASCGLGRHLAGGVAGQPGASMGEYWEKTRG